MGAISFSEALKGYDPSQPRDGRGRWTDTGASSVGNDDANPAVQGLKQYLEMVNRLQDGKGPAGLVLTHGRSYKFDSDSFKGSKSTRHKCYQCAGREALAHDDLTYVEGFISVHGVAIEHAWTVTKDGKVHDPTIGDGKGIGGYYGIPFKTSYVSETALRTKVWGLLSYTNRAILEHKPEDYVRKGNPEFDPNQPRNEDGTWGGDGESFEVHDGVLQRDFSGTVGNLTATYIEQAGPQVNVALRSGTPLDFSVGPNRFGEYDTAEAMVRAVDQFIAAHTVTKELTLWRGLAGDFVRNVLFTLNPGDVVVDKAFVSTSDRVDVATEYATDPVYTVERGDLSTALMQITVPRGANVGVASQISMSDEFILPRGSRLVYEGRGDAGTHPVLRFRYEPPVAKGNPEFDPNQPRNPDGTWGGGGGGSEQGGGGWGGDNHIRRIAILWPSYKRAAQRYSVETDQEINGALRRDNGDLSKLSASLRKEIEELDGYTRVYELAKPATLYRATAQGKGGVSVRAMLASLKVGDELSFPNFLSTSYDYNTASDMAGWDYTHDAATDEPVRVPSKKSALLQISAPAGVQFGPMYKHSLYGSRDDQLAESEILLPRNTKLRFEGMGQGRDKRPLYKFYIRDW